MTTKSPSIWSLVLVPAILTLVVTIVRLVGELQGWNDQFFSNGAPGPEQKSGFVGIFWLIPIFGFWFGLKLRRGTGEPSSAAKAAVIFLIGGVVLVGGFVGLNSAGLVSMPNPEVPAEPFGLSYLLGLVAVALLVMFIGWPRLARTLILYGVLARIPVVAVTYLAMQYDWDCHYTKLPTGMLIPQGQDPFVFLAMPQFTFWIAATTLIGGLFGCLGAGLAGRRGK